MVQLLTEPAGGFLDQHNADELTHGEFFSIERLEEYAVELARSQRVAPPQKKKGRGDAPVFARLRLNERKLTEAYRELASAARPNAV